MEKTPSQLESESRIVELEAKALLAEDQLDALNLTVYRQQQQIDRLERELRVVRDQVDSVSAATAANAPAQELPPHY